MRKITRQIYLGDAGDASDNEALKKAKITAVLNVANGAYAGPDYLSFKSLKVGLLDDGSDQDMLKRLAVSTLRILVDAGEIVLVHCGAGISRSAYIIARYMSKRNKSSIRRSLNWLKQLAPEIDENTPLL